MQGSSDPNRELLDATAFCRHLVEKGSVADFLTDHRQELFSDELFADLFPSGRGRPSVPADVIATVMVLQSLEGLSDRDAARQLRTNIAWKGGHRDGAGRSRFSCHGAHAVAEPAARLSATTTDLRCGAGGRRPDGHPGNAPSSRAGFHRPGRRGHQAGHADAVGGTDPRRAPPDPRSTSTDAGGP